MTGQKPLGTAEKAALIALCGTGGVWKQGSRWRWESRYWTVLVLQALVRRGFVHEKVAGEVYEVTTSGRSYAAKIPAPVPRRQPEPDISAIRRGAVRRSLATRSARR